MASIKPTIGRVVWYFANANQDRPNVALICDVHSDTYISVAGFYHGGTHFSATSVPLLQEGDARPEHGCFATWMPYQHGQAAKTEALEKQVAGS